jgi:hypothetical protein
MHYLTADFFDPLLTIVLDLRQELQSPTLDGRHPEVMKRVCEHVGLPLDKLIGYPEFPLITASVAEMGGGTWYPIWGPYDTSTTVLLRLRMSADMIVLTEEQVARYRRGDGDVPPDHTLWG